MEGTACVVDGSTSLVPLETNGQFSRIGTASQLKLHRRWWGLRDRIITAFERSDDESLQNRGSRLDGCCASPLVHGAPNGKATLVLQCCRDRLCPRCQRARGREASTRISKLIRGWSSCRFATLTLKHRDSELSAELNRIHEAFRSLRKSPEWKARVREGVWSIEVTRNPASKKWHVHIHLLFQGEYFPQKLLSSLWLAATEDSPVVDVRAVADREKTAHYIAEYVSKPLDAEQWSNEEICEYAAAMHGRRLIHTFGKAHGARVDSSEVSENEAASEFVAPLRPLIAAADAGDSDARHAIEILCRISPVYAQAAARDPIPAHAVAPPVEEWEHAIVLAQAARCFAELLERQEGRPTPQPSAATRPREQQLHLHDGPRTW
jgi:replication protein